MPSTSPGNVPTSPTPFIQILPGAPSKSLQTIACFVFRHKRYVAYISGHQLNILTSPTTLALALTFKEALVALTAETHTGKLVVASKNEAWAVEPVSEGWSKLSWEKVLFLRRDDPGDETSCLSWGIDGELLVGGSRQLAMFSTLPSSRTSTAPNDEETAEERRSLWTIHVPSSLQFAAFSPSASLIATCGNHDRLVKIWRRLSFEEGLFDYFYLPHPRAVTHLQWRPPDEHSDQESKGRYDEEPEVLYTISTDAVLRVWKTGGSHELEIMMLHTTVELISAIPESPSLTVKGEFPSAGSGRHARYTYIVPSDQFSTAVSTAMALEKTEKISHTLEHLKNVTAKEMDVVISFDGHGRMSAWGLQSVGHKRRPDTPSDSAKQAYHIAHAEGMPLRITDGVNARFLAWFEGSVFNLAAHIFGEEIRWWRGDVEGFFSPSGAGSERLSEDARWSGHDSGPITALTAAAKGQDLVSHNGKGEVVHWRPGPSGTLLNEAAYMIGTKILDAVLLTFGEEHDSHCVTLEFDPGSITLRLRNFAGLEVDRISVDAEHECDDGTWRLFSQNDDENAQIRLVVLNVAGKAFTCAVPAPTSSDELKLRNHVDFSLPIPQEQGDALLHFVVTPNATSSERVCVVAVSRSGSLLLYDFGPTEEQGLSASQISEFESGVSAASILVANDEFAAVVSADGDTWAIVNLKDGYVEHRQSLSGKIKRIVLAPNQNMVAAGYDTTINILAQGRYEHQDQMPPWILARQISIAGIGLTINALAWLGDGRLAVAAGNGIFVSSNEVSVDELHEDIQEVIDVTAGSSAKLELTTLAEQLRKPVPVWHPSFVAHTVRHGHWSLIANLVGRLSQKLKFWSEGDALHPLLNVPAEQFSGAERTLDHTLLDQETACELIKQLEDRDLPLVSQNEQKRLKRIVQALTFCFEHVNGLDNSALRFLFSWKLDVLIIQSHQPDSRETNGTIKDENTIVPKMHWREIAFAYHSTTQQPLLEILIAHYDNRITWDTARRLGLFAWLSDRDALDQTFEALAQFAYRSTSPPDPINASVYFLALHKKATLLGLWRIATWHKEQRATSNFLRRDFSQPENKTAAKKNAYALMGKRRFEYAASFFLLADDGASATSVLAGQYGDVMLAIAVARLFSGDNSEVTRGLVRNRLIPEAKQKGDRWLLSWSHSLLSEREKAADALVCPLDSVRSWHQDDPNTLTLYKHLRKNDSKYEYEAVLRASRILRRMGMLLLALELVSQWKFTRVAPTRLRSLPKTPNGVHVEKARADGVAEAKNASTSPLPISLDDEAARKAKAAELLTAMKAKKEGPQVSVEEEKKPAPTQFHEPEANSLLDNFGFREYAETRDDVVLTRIAHLAGK